MDRWMTEFRKPVAAGDGRSYTARAWGQPQSDGQWEGWIEFEPLEPGPLVRAPAAATLEARADFDRWTAGISTSDLETALDQAIDRRAPEVETAPAGSRRPEGGVDPFAAYAGGEGALRDALGAAEERQLRAVIRGHHWIDEQQIDLERIGRFVLEEMIVSAVRRRVASRVAA